MKLIKISIITLAILFSFQFAKAQSISIGASFGYRYPHHKVIVADDYRPYYAEPVYYDRSVYYERPRYYASRSYCRPYYHSTYYRSFHGHRRW